MGLTNREHNLHWELPYLLSYWRFLGSTSHLNKHQTDQKMMLKSTQNNTEETLKLEKIYFNISEFKHHISLAFNFDHMDIFNFPLTI